MADAEIPVDLLNPGHVFACLGFLEAAEILLGDVEGGFDWSGERAEGVIFRLRVRGEGNPIEAVLTFLAEAEVKALAPANSRNSTAKWKVPTVSLRQDDPFPFPDPPSPATLPAWLGRPGEAAITIDHWGEATSRTKRDTVKFWAGSGGYPGAALASDALDLARAGLINAAHDPFSVAMPQSSSFRFDWRRDYIPMDTGFSPNDHGNLTMVGFPLVEILAAIGLTNARPQRIHKLDYRYGVIGSSPARACYDPMFLRAALGGATLPFPQRIFRMRLGWPGQENQARCITDVVEENPP
jgi:CRISPR-associated protein Csx14